MAKQKAFPTTHEGKNSYYTAVLAYLLLNATRLQVSSDRMDALTALMGNISTPNTWVFLWAQYILKRGKRTGDVIDTLNILVAQIESLLAEIYHNIPEELWTVSDRSAFQRKTGARAARTVHTEPIADLCYVLLKAQGGGGVKAKCRTNEDSTRASKPELADAVEIAWRIDPPEPDPENVGKTKFYRIKAPNDGTTLKIFTKASFTGKFGAENAGSMVQGYARWTNTKHPNLAGLWTGPYSIILT